MEPVVSRRWGVNLRSGVGLWRAAMAALLLTQLVLSCSPIPPIDARIAGFKPVAPEQKLDMNSFRLIVPITGTRYPVLAWEPFPGRKPDRLMLGSVPFVSVDPSQARDIAYDLRIWEVAGGAPSELVYEREGLPEPRHKVETKLKRKTFYFWSVRARFTVGGELRLTPWSMAMVRDTHLRVSQLGTIPPEAYYRFRTP